jgi:hypothetical protein
VPLDDLVVAALSKPDRDAWLHARTWVDVAEERVQHRGAANGSVRKPLTFHKHRMHTRSWLMHVSKPQAAWPRACTRSPTLRSLGRHSFIGAHNETHRQGWPVSDHPANSRARRNAPAMGKGRASQGMVPRSAQFRARRDG